MENIDNFKFISFNNCYKNEGKLFKGFGCFILLFEMLKLNVYE